MRKIIYTVWLCCLSVVIAGHLSAQEEGTMVLIDTDKGKIKIRLYDETPQHRDNFIKLVNARQYDGLLFHRVIKQFMIQAGDITSKDAPPEKKLGDGDFGFSILYRNG